MEKVKTLIDLSLRVLLSAVFIYAAVSKILRPDEFYTDIRNYQIVSGYIAYASAYFLPAFEIVAALAIFSKRFFKVSILSIAFLLAVFIMALSSAWYRGLDINCGCFGSGAPSDYGIAILRDVFLLLICFILVLINSKNLSLFYRMKGNKVILVAIAIPMVAVLLAFLFIYLKGNSKSAENILPVDEYIIRPMSFAGNSYAFTASIVSQLAYSDTRGRIILVKPQSANGQLPILVPPTVENFNPQVSQIFTFWVKIDSEGKLIMTDFKKM